jgi:TRAP-type C4-dicarboxylate transport system permease small subunit
MGVLPPIREENPQGVATIHEPFGPAQWVDRERKRRIRMKLGRWVELFENGFLVIAVFSSVAISVAGVFFRYVVESSLSWVEESAGFLLLIIITVGIGVAVRRGSHLRVDMLIQFIPRTKKSLNFFANIFALGVMTVLFILAIEFVSDLLIRNQRTTSIYWLPIGVPLLIMPLGYLTAVYRAIESLFTLFKKGTD